MPRRHGADGGQAVNDILAERGYDVSERSTPRARRSLAAKHGSHNRRLSRSTWRNLARIVDSEEWDAL